MRELYQDNYFIEKLFHKTIPQNQSIKLSSHKTTPQNKVPTTNFGYPYVLSEVCSMTVFRNVVRKSKGDIQGFYGIMEKSAMKTKGKRNEKKKVDIPSSDSGIIIRNGLFYMDASAGTAFCFSRY